MSLHKKFLVAFVIVMIAFGLRYHLARNGPVEYDEYTYLRVAQQYAHSIRDGNWVQLIENPSNYEHPAFNKLIYGVVLATRPIADNLVKLTVQDGGSIKDAVYFYRLLGLRMVSGFFGVMTVLVLALVNPLAGLFLAISTYAIKYTSVIYLEAMPMFFSLLSVVSFEKLLFKSGLPQKSPHRFPFWFWLSAVSMGLAVASKYVYGLPIIAIVAVIIQRSRKNKTSILLFICVWLFVILSTFFLADIHLWHVPLDRFLKTLNYHLAYTSQSKYVLSAAYPFWQPFSWLAIPISWQLLPQKPFFYQKGDFLIAIEPLTLILAVFGFKKLYQEHSLFFWWFVIGFLFLLIWNTKWPQYILTVLAPFCLAAGLGVRVIHGWLRKWIGSRSVDST
jgi:4-amino-4-deoxy-L-arabinose transferase-like glycosyltransferase